MSEYSPKNIEKHPRYENALTMVLWGEEKEKVYHMFTVNNVSQDIGDLIYAHAVKNRVKTLRTIGYPKIIKGSLFLFFSGLLFYLFWFMGGAITHSFGTGIADVLSAPFKKGSVAD